MLDCLATSLTFSFKWFSMFDVDQTFITQHFAFSHEQMLDRLATSATEACASGKKATDQKRNLFFGNNNQKELPMWTHFARRLINRPFSHRTVYATHL